MSRPDFRRYIESQEPRSEDADTRKQEWLAALERLFGDVEAWLREYEPLGVTCEREPHELNEEGLGRYQATAMRITLRRREAWLEPVGTYIIGALGRADLK